MSGGGRVKTAFGTTTTLYIGNHYQLITFYPEDFNCWTIYTGTWV